MSAWTQRQPIEARCGCRIDFLAIDTHEYAMVFSECALGDDCAVAWEVARDIDRTFETVAAL